VLSSLANNVQGLFKFNEPENDPKLKEYVKSSEDGSSMHKETGITMHQEQILENSKEYLQMKIKENMIKIAAQNVDLSKDKFF